MRSNFSVVRVLACLVLCGSALAQDKSDPAERVALIAPFVDEKTFAIAHADLSRIDFSEAVKTFTANILTPESDKEKSEMADGLKMANKMRGDLLQAGAVDWYFVFTLAGLEKGGNTPGFVVIPVKAGRNAEKVSTLIGTLIPSKPMVIKGAVVLGPPEVEDWLKEAKLVSKPEFARGFAAAEDTAAQLVFVPTQAIRELRLGFPPAFPKDLADRLTTLQTTVEWAALTANAPPKPALALTLQMKDAKSAVTVHDGAAAALEFLATTPFAKDFPNFEAIVKALTPKVNGSQLRIVLSESNGGIKTAYDALAPLARNARDEGHRMQSANNLKEFGMALWRYHDAHMSLPAQYRASAEKKLLSWRVELLPYLEQKDLYDQFHLNEAWDSEHNRKLIEKMPEVFASPALSSGQKAKGLTNYLAPAGKGMIFDGTSSTRFADVRDGTSNTIMVVEVAPDSAVVWTKPEDLPIDLTMPLKKLTGQGQKNNRKGFFTLFCDGSVHFLNDNVDATTLSRLFQMADGMPVGDY
jgi:hypothetical protein